MGVECNAQDPDCDNIDVNNDGEADVTNLGYFCWSPADWSERYPQEDEDFELGQATPEDPSMCLPMEAAYCGDADGLAVVSDAQAVLYDTLFGQVAAQAAQTGQVPPPRCPQGARFVVHGSLLEQLILENLVSIPGALEINENLLLQEVRLEQLVEIGRGLFVQDNANLTALTLPRLRRISTDDQVAVGAAQLVISDNPQLRSVAIGVGAAFNDAAALTQAVASNLRVIAIQNNPELSTCRAVQLAVEVMNAGFTGTINISGNRTTSPTPEVDDEACAALLTADMTSTELCQAIDANGRLALAVGRCRS